MYENCKNIDELLQKSSQSQINNCFISVRAGEYPLFSFDASGRCRVNLCGYVIAPIEDFDLSSI